MTKNNINQQTAQIKRRSGYSSIPNAAMADTSISIEARGLLALLMSFKEGWVFHPRHLMKKCGVGKDKYYRMSGELKTAGYLQISPSHNDGSGRFNGCQWQINDIPEILIDRNPGNTEYGKQVPIRETKREVSKQVIKDIGKPISKNKQNGFDNFWNCYPNKVGKGAARLSFSKALKLTDLKTLMDGLEKYVNKTDDRAWCNPTTWLNQERWCDEPATIPKQKDKQTTASVLNDLANSMEGTANGHSSDYQTISGDVKRLPRPHPIARSNR